MLAVALAALATNGLRELPVALGCYRHWQGVTRAERDVELIGGASGLESAAGRRAILNAHQARDQSQAFCLNRLPNLISVAGGAVAGAWLLGLVLGGPITRLRDILGMNANRHRVIIGNIT